MDWQNFWPMWPKKVRTVRKKIGAAKKRGLREVDIGRSESKKIAGEQLEPPIKEQRKEPGKEPEVIRIYAYNYNI